MNYFKIHNHEEFISENRIRALEGAVFLFVAIVIGRLFYLQVLEHDKYIALAQKQGQSLQVVLPERGEIFAQADNKSEDNLYSLAVNQIFYQVYVDPEKVTRPKNIADLFVTLFSLSEADILPKLEKTGDNYELLVKKASQEQVDKLQISLDQLLATANADKAKKDKVDSMGVYWKKEILRFYPDKEVGAQMLGFLAPDDSGENQAGKYGLEAYWQKELAGSGEQIATAERGPAKGGKEIDKNKHIPYKSIVPLPEIIADYLQVNKSSKKVQTLFFEIISKSKNEFEVLLDLDLNSLNKIMPENLANGIIKVRSGEIKLSPGFDGQYGKTEIFSPQEKYATQKLF